MKKNFVKYLSIFFILLITAYMLPQGMLSVNMPHHDVAKAKAFSNAAFDPNMLYIQPDNRKSSFKFSADTSDIVIGPYGSYLSSFMQWRQSYCFLEDRRMKLEALIPSYFHGSRNKPELTFC